MARGCGVVCSRRWTWLLTLGLVMLAIGLGACGDPEHVAPPPAGEPSEPTRESVDWARVEPLAFLDLLAATPTTHFNVSQPPPADWIREAHLPALLARVREESRAAVVVSVRSSYVPFGRRSTVGREAMFLIEGFREGRYPPRLCSVHYFDPDPDEYEAWWRAFSADR